MQPAIVGMVTHGWIRSMVHDRPFIILNGAPHTIVSVMLHRTGQKRILYKSSIKKGEYIFLQTTSTNKVSSYQKEQF